MQIIEGVLFEPVGCLAEFPAEPFHEIAARLFGRRKKPSTSGSRSYWHLLNLMQAANRTLDASEKNMVEGFEVQAVDAASAYDDVVPALSELKAMGIRLCIASSLSSTAIARFLERYSLHEFYSAVWSRDNAGRKDRRVTPSARRRRQMPAPHAGRKTASPRRDRGPRTGVHAQYRGG